MESGEEQGKGQTMMGRKGLLVGHGERGSGADEQVSFGAVGSSKWGGVDIGDSRSGGAYWLGRGV